MQKTEAIKVFLESKTHPDLAQLYNFNMEVQVNVAQDGGERIEGGFRGRQWHGWTDSFGNVWKSFRIPHNARTEPQYTDSGINFDIQAHAEGIGMTGWDWTNRQSLWVAFDFDAIIGHSDRHGKKLEQDKLDEVQQAAMSIPWVTVRRSTSGKGLHLYVFLEPIKTSNHTEHAALGRAILGMMSGMTGFDFQSKVDNCGGNMWVWHRKMTGTTGLELIKQGSLLAEIPKNWTDHVQVVSGQKRKLVPFFIQESTIPESERMFLELTGQRQRINLDDQHKRLIAWLQDNNCAGWWVTDHNMLVTHTIHLKDAHKELSFKGIFDTISEGTEKGIDHNCFCFPSLRGSWVVRRFTPGVNEASSWHQDGSGWTRCFYNQEPDLPTIARTKGASELTSGGFYFIHATSAIEAAGHLGATVKLPQHAMFRNAKLKEHKDGRLVFQLKRDEGDTADDFKGWNVEKKEWTKIFSVQASTPSEASDSMVYDDLVRHLVTTQNDNYGWAIASEGHWRSEPLEHIRPAMESMNLSPKEVKQILGSSILKCWTIVNRPFEPEYPGDRQWNRGAAQLRFTPTQDKEEFAYPTWQKILDHIGSNLDEVIQDNPWAKANGVLKGADYLMCWLASLIQEPTEPLPYLFLYGPQNCGKSIFHEAFQRLVTSGCKRANTALVSPSEHNGELENAILCVIEETDLNKNKTAYNRLKDWVTAPHIQIHVKYQTPYMAKNTTHWVHCSNHWENCPIFPGDTRITMIHVKALDPLDLIPKRHMFEKLDEEAPDFLAALLALELPESTDRLRVPVVVTEDKTEAARANMNLLEQFIATRCFEIPGQTVSFGFFVQEFHHWIKNPADYMAWGKVKVGQELPDRFPRGKWRQDNSQYHIGNLTLDPTAKADSRIIRDPVNKEFLIREKL